MSSESLDCRPSLQRVSPIDCTACRLQYSRTIDDWILLSIAIRLVGLIELSHICFIAMGTTQINVETLEADESKSVSDEDRDSDNPIVFFDDCNLQFQSKIARMSVVAMLSVRFWGAVLVAVLHFFLMGT